MFLFTALSGNNYGSFAARHEHVRYTLRETRVAGDLNHDQAPQITQYAFRGGHCYPRVS